MQLIIRISFVLSLFVSTLGISQDLNAGLYIDLGYSIDKFDNAGINQFSTTSNNFWGAELEDGWDQISDNALSPPFFGIGFKGLSAEKIGFSWAMCDWLSIRKRQF